MHRTVTGRAAGRHPDGDRGIPGPLADRPYSGPEHTVHTDGSRATTGLEPVLSTLVDGAHVRVLLTTHGMLSNLRGVFPMAHALRRAGHDVAVGTTAAMKPYVESEGMRHLPAGLDWRGEMVREVQELGGELGPRLRDDDLRYGLALRHFTGPTALAAASALIEASGTWRPDLVVRSWVEFGGYLAAEALDIPHVSLGISGGPVSRLLPRALAPPLAAHRRELGLPPDPEGHTLYRYRHVALVPEAYDPAIAAVPNTVHHRHENALQAHDRIPDELAEALARGGGQPLVLVGFGTLAPMLRGADAPRVESLMRAVVGALARLDCVAVVAGRDMPLGDWADAMPAHVHFAGDFPPSLLLGQCDVFVTHAGFNSVRESLSHGVPMVAVPLIAEQSYNAARCSDLGVARVVGLDDATADRIAGHCREILNDPSYAARAGEMRGASRELPSLDACATGLRSVARNRLPRTRHADETRTDS